MSYGEIYIVKNLINGKVYVGQTTMGATRRWASHVSAASNESGLSFPLYRAIRKYGKEAFSIDVVDVAETKEDLDQKEVSAISRFKSLDYRNGYNAKEGGSRGRLSDESKAKMSASRSGDKHFRKGKQLSEDHKKKLSEAGKRRVSSFETRMKRSTSLMGHPVSAETRRKIGDAKRGHVMPPHVLEALRNANLNRPSTLRIPILCITNGVKFSSGEEAALFAGVSKSSMSRHLNGMSKLAGGLQFRKL